MTDLLIAIAVAFGVAFALWFAFVFGLLVVAKAIGRGLFGK